MELIRLYYNSIDVQPSVLIRHFARYLGLYVEENTDRENNNSKSLADIYIISNEYFGEQDTFLEIPYENKTILILKDDFITDDTRVSTVEYSGNPKLENKFLHELLATLCGIIEKCNLGFTTLLQGDEDYEQIIIYLVDAYLSHNIMQASLYNRCFYKEKHFFHMAIEKYKGFIKDIEDKRLYFRESDLLEYILIYAKYEINIICKKNLRNFPYASEDLLNQCKELLYRHPENEELYLLKADIQLELQEKWLWASDDFADSHVSHCAYADYRRGEIFRSYLKEYDNAEYLLKNAVRKKKDYVYAWYQLGICYENQAKYKKAIDAFNNIVTILKEKYTKHLLAPMEMEYMYNAVMRTAAVYKTRLGDYMSAYVYNDFAKMIQIENAVNGYLEQTWSGFEDMKNEDAFHVINDTLNEKIDLKLEEIY